MRGWAHLLADFDAGFRGRSDRERDSPTGNIFLGKDHSVVTANRASSVQCVFHTSSLHSVYSHHDSSIRTIPSVSTDFAGTTSL